MILQQAIADGYSDSGYERNALFHNRGDGTFGEVGCTLEADRIEDGCTFAAFDADRDGDSDLILRDADPIGAAGPALRFLRNERGNRRNWLRVDLAGKGNNRFGIGARVSVSVAGRTLVRELGAGSSYLAQHGNQLLFGLGDAERVERIEVRWPDGSSDSLEGLAVPAAIRIDQAKQGWEAVSATDEPGK